MKFKEIIGIDVSKNQIDVYQHSEKIYNQFANGKTGFKKMLQWLWQHINASKEEVLFAFEHTGLYSLNLSIFLDENHYNFTIIPGLELKRSLGISRGKDDKVDAKRLAEYAYEKQEKLRLYQMPSKTLLKVKRLLSYRESLTKQKAGFLARLKEYQSFLEPEEEEVLFKSHHEGITFFEQQIQKIDDELYGLIKKDEQLYFQYKLINTIKGVGHQTALIMIVLTNGFTQFSNWRKFASYAGTAPFPNESGKFKGKSKISHLANKRIKTLLSCCASTAIQHNPEMRMYFQNRIAENKNEMCTLNIIRNKLLARIFAVVKRGTPYVETYGYAA